MGASSDRLGPDQLVQVPARLAPVAVSAQGCCLADAVLQPITLELLSSAAAKPAPSLGTRKETLLPLVPETRPQGQWAPRTDSQAHLSRYKAGVPSSEASGVETTNRPIDQITNQSTK